MTVTVHEYKPNFLLKPPRLISVPTAWNGVESILVDMMQQFNIKGEVCIEFGVDYGYSTAALANCFKDVIGVDTFQGDCHAGYRDNLLEQTKHALNGFPNVFLIQSDYRDFIKQDHGRFDLCHVDIVHEYSATNELAYWAVHHSDVVMLHDYVSFPDVARACQDVAWETGRKLYVWPECHGVAFLVKQ